MALNLIAIALAWIALRIERIIAKMTSDRTALDDAIANVPQQVAALLQPAINSLKSKATPDGDFAAEIAMLSNIGPTIAASLFPPTQAGSVDPGKTGATPSTNLPAPTGLSATITTADPTTAAQIATGSETAPTGLSGGPIQGNSGASS